MADSPNIELAVVAASDVENADAGTLRLFLDFSNSNQLSTKDEFGTVALVGAGAGGMVASVFTRTGAVTAMGGDYEASLVTNDSGVSGATVADALDMLLAAIGAVVSGFVPNGRTLTAGAGMTGGGDLSANRTFNVGANADGSVVVNADDIQVGVLATDAQHGVRGGGTQHAAATTSVAGFMSSADKTKLDALGAVLISQVVLAANKSTTNVANPPATDKLLTNTVTIAGTFLLIRAMAHASGSTGIRIYFAIYVDGALMARDWAFADTVSGEGEANFEVLVTGLSPGARVIDLYWSVNTAGTASCNVVTTPELHRATLTAQYS